MAEVEISVGWPVGVKRQVPGSRRGWGSGQGKLFFSADVLTFMKAALAPILWFRR